MEGPHDGDTADRISAIRRRAKWRRKNFWIPAKGLWAIQQPAALVCFSNYYLLRDDDGGDLFAAGVADGGTSRSGFCRELSRCGFSSCDGGTGAGIAIFSDALGSSQVDEVEAIGCLSIRFPWMS